jgi:hypothetical protein
MSVMAVLKMLAAVRNIVGKMIMHFKNKPHHAVAYPNDLASKPGVTSVQYRRTAGCKKIQLHSDQIGPRRAHEGVQKDIQNRKQKNQR